jgi:hypothetical protein
MSINSFPNWSLFVIFEGKIVDPLVSKKVEKKFTDYVVSSKQQMVMTQNVIDLNRLKQSCIRVLKVLSIVIAVASMIFLWKISLVMALVVGLACVLTVNESNKELKTLSSYLTVYKPFMNEKVAARFRQEITPFTDMHRFMMEALIHGDVRKLCTF